MSKGKWVSVLAVWGGKNDYGKYITVKPEEGYQLVILKDGEQIESYDNERPLFINENQYREDNPKAPYYKLLRKSYNESDNVDDFIADEQVDNDDVPF